MKRTILLVFMALGLALVALHSHSRCQIANRVATPKLQTFSPAPDPKKPKVNFPLGANADKEKTEFHQLISQAFEILPRVEVLKLHRDHSQPPPELLQAGTPFGQIEDSLRSNPSLAPQAVEFYRACADDTEMLFAIRALCFRDLRYWSERVEGAMPIAESHYPASVVRAANSIPAPEF